MTTREFARLAMRRMRLPVPSGTRTLHVHTPPGYATPQHRTQCLCHLLAQYVWRAAHEQSCSNIVVHNGPVHVHEFDTVDLFTRSVLKRCGFWPKVQTVRGVTPPQMATLGHRALGNTLEPYRPIFHVPTAVSSDVAGGKG